MVYSDIILLLTARLTSRLLASMRMSQRQTLFGQSILTPNELVLFCGVPFENKQNWPSAQHPRNERSGNSMWSQLSAALYAILNPRKYIQKLSKKATLLGAAMTFSAEKLSDENREILTLPSARIVKSEAELRAREVVKNRFTCSAGGDGDKIELEDFSRPVRPTATVHSDYDRRYALSTYAFKNQSCLVPKTAKLLPHSQASSLCQNKAAFFSSIFLGLDDASPNGYSEIMICPNRNIPATCWQLSFWTAAANDLEDFVVSIRMNRNVYALKKLWGLPAYVSSTREAELGSGHFALSSEAFF
ncbi:hypothetical protein T265_11564 [Opisthorchis viverrini]|uniref:Uncharacterized protein n=1 Tax=Opisthorchis viverrini TaxID=6198 RepID=A0A074YYL1_OPIVI|nr:hypothetical protein T265_11564 [Opisthorchis viverrini]KER19738.1 hypothetical protein T265_11564 [Opisthorchis viverrini]